MTLLTGRARVRPPAFRLLSHIEPDRLCADVRDQCVVHSSGARLYSLRWL